MKTNYSILKLMLSASIVFVFSLIGIAKNSDESNDVLKAYLNVKDALVKTDVKSASEAAKNLVTVIGNSSNDLMEKIAENAKQIESSVDVEAQRSYFNDLSENVYQLIKGSSGLNEPVYRQFCPMAFNHKGAYWLSADKEVNNPYFGNKMLHCGTIKEEL